MAKTTPADLEILIQQGEGATLEFKEALSPSSFAREIVALENTIGGKVLLGVRDDGSWSTCARATPSRCSAATASSGGRAR